MGCLEAVQIGCQCCLLEVHPGVLLFLGHLDGLVVVRVILAGLLVLGDLVVDRLCLVGLPFLEVDHLDHLGLLCLEEDLLFHLVAFIREVVDRLVGRDCLEGHLVREVYLLLCSLSSIMLLTSA